MKNKMNIELSLDYSMYDKAFRNCLAHYGLRPFINEIEIQRDDILVGLTMKAFSMDYYSAKGRLFVILKDLVGQIERLIF